MQKKMKVRIVFGSIMLALLAGLLVLDWWMQRRWQWPTMLTLTGKTVNILGLPLAILCLAMLVPAFGEVRRLVAGVGVTILTVSVIFWLFMIASWRVAVPHST